MAVQRDDEVLAHHYTCSGCTWPGAIQHPTDRLASGHAKAEGHTVQKWSMVTTTWMRFGPGPDDPIG